MSPDAGQLHVGREDTSQLFGLVATSESHPVSNDRSYPLVHVSG